MDLSIAFYIYVLIFINCSSLHGKSYKKELHKYNQVQKSTIISVPNQLYLPDKMNKHMISRNIILYKLTDSFSHSTNKIYRNVAQKNTILFEVNNIHTLMNKLLTKQIKQQFNKRFASSYQLSPSHTTIKIYSRTPELAYNNVTSDRTKEVEYVWGDWPSFPTWSKLPITSTPSLKTLNWKAFRSLFPPIRSTRNYKTSNRIITNITTRIMTGATRTRDIKIPTRSKAAKTLSHEDQIIKNTGSVSSPTTRHKNSHPQQDTAIGELDKKRWPTLKRILDPYYDKYWLAGDLYSRTTWPVHIHRTWTDTENRLDPVDLPKFNSINKLVIGRTSWYKSPTKWVSDGLVDWHENDIHFSDYSTDDSSFHFTEPLSINGEFDTMITSNSLNEYDNSINQDGNSLICGYGPEKAEDIPSTEPELGTQRERQPYKEENGEGGYDETEEGENESHTHNIDENSEGGFDETKEGEGESFETENDEEEINKSSEADEDENEPSREEDENGSSRDVNESSSEEEDETTTETVNMGEYMGEAIGHEESEDKFDEAEKGNGEFGRADEEDAYVRASDKQGVSSDDKGSTKITNATNKGNVLSAADNVEGDLIETRIENDPGASGGGEDSHEVDNAGAIDRGGNLDATDGLYDVGAGGGYLRVPEEGHDLNNIGGDGIPVASSAEGGVLRATGGGGDPGTNAMDGDLGATNEKGDTGVRDEIGVPGAIGGGNEVDATDRGDKVDDKDQEGDPGTNIGVGGDDTAGVVDVAGPTGGMGDFDPTGGIRDTGAPALAYDTSGPGGNGVGEDKTSNCYTCGLDDEGIPLKSECFDAFDYLDQRFTWVRKNYKKACGGGATGCFKRFLDVGSVYYEKGCRSSPPKQGKSFASIRFANLEILLKDENNSCVFSPNAILTPFGRGIYLWVRYHVCVCTGNYCNAQSKLLSQSCLVLLMFILISLN